MNWRLVRRPLERAAQLDMRGDPDSGGVWAPCLSYADGKFWLVYTDVKRLDGDFKDAHNYIVTAPSIEAEWSDPVYVNSSGFDPSLFHDDDGRKWFVNMVWSHRDTGEGLPNPYFDGIALQEWDAASGKLLGRPKIIFKGSPLGLVEGPHLFKRDGWVYLTTAEGGTGYDHAVTMARSRQHRGPVRTASERASAHVEGRAGRAAATRRARPDRRDARRPVYHTHLCSRPLKGLKRSPLGRETAIQKCVWGDDGWLYLAQGGQVPACRGSGAVRDAGRAARPPADLRFRSRPAAA